MLKIGKVIKAKRKECELTQEELATLLGVTKAAVSKYETERNAFPVSCRVRYLFLLLKK